MGIESMQQAIVDDSATSRQSSDGFRVNMADAYDYNPDDEAEKRRLQKQTGVPALLMDEEVKAQAKRQSYLEKLSGVEAEAPGTTSFLAKPDNAKLAHDDIENMTGLERAFDVVKKSLRGLSASPFSASQGLWAVPRVAGDIIQTATKPIADATGLPDVGGALADWAAGWQRFEEQTAKAVRGNTAGAGLLERGFYSGMESLGQNLLTLPLTIASGGSAAPMLASMSLSTGGQAYGQARDKKIPAIPAAIFAGSQGLIEYATEKIPALKFVEGLKLKTGLAKFAKEMIGSELIGEETATLTQDLNEWAVLNPEKPFSEYLKERPSAAAETMIATIVGAGGQVAAAKGLERAGYSVEKYMVAQHSKNFMLALGDSSKSSKLRARMPEKYRELVDHIKEGGDVENVYIPADEWKTYFQTKEMDPATVAEDTMDGGSKQYAEALATGGDVVIPLEVYAEKLAASEHHNSLIESSRLRPGDMTAKEAGEFEKNREAITAEIMDQLQAEAQTAEADRSPHLKVYDDIFGQLQKIGYDRGTAEKLATLAAARAKQRGDVLGKDAFDLYNESPLKITRPLPDALQRHTVDLGLDPLLDRLRAADVPDDSTIFGQSLLQFLRGKGIKDHGGDLAAMDASAGAKKPGQKNLVRSDGLPLDRAQEVAAEAGYLPGDSTVADFLDLIDQELRGDAVYSATPANEQAMNERLALDQLQEELNKRGIDLSQMDNAAVRSQLFQGAQEGALWQSAWHGSPHTFDKFTTDAIGTGEGAQAYGYGLYFAGNREVAEYYKRTLSEDGFGIPTIDGVPVNELQSLTWDEAQMLILEVDERPAKTLTGEAAKTFLLNHLEKFKGNPNYAEAYPQAKARVERTDASLIEVPGRDKQGRLYHVELAPEEDEYLLWDKPLSEQSELVKAALRAGAEKYRALVSEANALDDTAENDVEYERLRSEAKKYVGFMDPVNELDGNRSRRKGHDGNALYHALAEGDDGNGGKESSQILHSLGIRGIKYLDGTSRGNANYKPQVPKYQAKVERLQASFDANKTDEAKNLLEDAKQELESARRADEENKQNYNYVIFSDDDVQIKQMWQKGGGGERGFFRTAPGLPFREIGILERSDLSTFLHELGHSWLEELKQDAAREDAPEQLKQDWETVKAWAGIEGDEIPEEAHETFARGTEAYLMEGKAPSAELRPIFQRFKSWLVQIYKTIKGLKVTLNDDVRGVFDRLLASEEEITAARQTQGLADLFATAEDAGMTDAEFKAYRKQAAKAHAEEVERLDRKLMKELSREQHAWWKEARETMRGEVEDEAQALPVYRAIRLMSTGKMFDGSEGEVLKLSRADLVRMYGEPFLKRLPRGFNHIYSKEGGVHPDIAAEFFGFSSGDELVRAMIEAPPIKQYIEAETDMRMRETHGDMLLDGSIADEAVTALHNERRADVVRAELKAIRRHQAAAKPVLNAVKAEELAGRRGMEASIPPREVFELAAAQAIGAKKISEIDPRLYLAAERKAAKAAFEAVKKKDWAKAGEAKQQELLNHYLYREAVKAKEQIDKILKQYDAMKKPDRTLTKSRDINMVNAARAILSQYGIDKNGMHAAEYMALIREYSPEIYADLQAAVDAISQRPQDYKQLTMDEFLAVNDAVMNLWELSRRTKQVEIDGKMVNRDEVIGELAGGIKAIGLPKNRAGYNKAVTKGEKFKASLIGVKAAATRVEAWVEAMDMGDKKGPFRRYIWQPVAEAIDRYRMAKRDYIIKYLDLVKKIEPTLTHDKISASEIGYTFDGKQELLGALLHTGNRSNMEKLLVGRGWAYEAEDGGIDTEAWDKFTRRMWDEGKLTKADYDFIQGVWNLFEEIKPLSQKAHHDMYGYYFSEITHDAFMTPWGEYRGGYAPAITDSNIVQDQAMRQEREALESVNNSFMFPSTGRGFTKNRVKYNKPLILDLRLVPSHIDKVLRFSFIEPRVKDVGRILVNHEFRDIMGQFDASAVNDMLVPWLQRSARQVVETPSTGTAGRAADTFFKALRRNSGMQMMVANVANTLQQYTGLFVSNTMVDREHLTSALFRYVKGPRDMAADVADKSEMMATRVMQSAYDMQQQAEDILINPNAYEKFKDFSIKNGYMMQQITQHTVDVVTWAGAYDQAVAAGEDEKGAVRQADSAVRMTQGSFNAEDISRLETGTPFVRAFTQFYTYFNMLSNLLGSQATAAVRSLGWSGAAPRLFFLYFMGFAVPAILSEALMMAARGGGDPGDDETDMLLQLLVGSQFRTGTAMVPVIGQGVNYLANLMNKKRYDDRISTAPFLTNLEAAGRAPISVYKLATDQGSLKMAVKDTLIAIGMASGTPMGALGRPLGYLAGMEDGKYSPRNGLDFARGIITGYPSR